MSPPERGGGGAGKGALLSGHLSLDILWPKYFANDHFSDSPRRNSSRNAICIFFVFGPHVGPMQAVCPRTGLTEEPQPPPPKGGGGREKGAHTASSPLEQFSTHLGGSKAQKAEMAAQAAPCHEWAI